MKYLGLVQNLDWVSPSRIFATTKEVFDSQPNYENEIAIALNTKIKYRGVAPVVGGWGYATGAPGPYPPTPDPPSVNDSFTKLMLEEEGLEGSRTHYDTNKAGWPRTWTHRGLTGGFGSITNVDELWDEGSLNLDGNTVITAPDSVDFTFKNGDFCIRGSFTCEFPSNETRVMFAKTHRWQFAAPNFPFNVPMLEYMFFVRRSNIGTLEVGVHTNQIFGDYLLDRFGNYIVDRQGQVIIHRHDPAYRCDSFSGLRDRFRNPIVDRFGEIIVGRDQGIRGLQTTTIYSDTINTGRHDFTFSRIGNTLTLKVDGVVEDTNDMCAEFVNEVPCPITIGGYGDPRELPHQRFVSEVSTHIDDLPWKGRLDRLAVDIGKGR